ncbi:glycosyltransferase family 2 protein [Galbibacter mesophilus]|uniref:glycosyltransferase family 2 protein n=1 Tax=Galbibacter mesophilus TaxID=379069 RepID=UPI00191ED221|nr:glycosyltransferase family 2 protein [Galbibacter mesophilus]MCM5663507.1 glycosyltransferase family 2 protein [Galbibacter mesophilus]
MTVALIIATYNWPEALELVLESVKKQSLIPDEIFIADDGSNNKTADLIQKFKSKNNHLNIIHEWHEDNGYRKSTILNNCIRKIQSDYIIQTDGDCILHKDFIKDHLHFAKKEQFICGLRAMLFPIPSSLLLQKKVKPNFLILNVGSKFNLKYQYKSYKLANKRSILYSINKNDAAYGCNMSYWKEDALLVNGYNEDFEGWGPEDAEFAQRLVNAKKKLFHLRHAGILYHLHHPLLSRGMYEKNLEIYKTTIADELTYCENGIIKE